MSDDSEVERAAKRNRTEDVHPQAVQHAVPLFSPGPADALTRHLHEQLLRHVGKTNIEVELRFCVLVEKNSSQRLRHTFATPAVVTAPHTADVGVSAHHFAVLSRQVDGVLERQAELAAVHGPMTLTETDTNDVKRNDVRVSFDAAGNAIEAMKKKRLSVVDIAVPGRAYDLRFAINEERPVPDIPADIRPDSHHARRKKRRSLRAAAFTFDATEVTTRTSPQHPPSTTHEFEIEGCFPVLGRDVDVAWVSTIMANAFGLLNCIDRR